MSTLAVGAIKKEAKPVGAFQLRWVTVWGVWVPPGFMPGLILALEDKGYTVKERGHTILTQTDPDNPGLIEEVREAIKAYAEGSWNVSG